MATSTINQMKDYSNPQQVAYFSDFSTTDGKNYTCRVKNIINKRFPILLMRGTQNSAFDPIVGMVSNSNNENALYFSDESVTYQDNIITVYTGVSAWARPAIIYPLGFIEFE